MGQNAHFTRHYSKPKCEKTKRTSFGMQGNLNPLNRSYNVTSSGFFDQVLFMVLTFPASSLNHHLHVALRKWDSGITNFWKAYTWSWHMKPPRCWKEFCKATSVNIHLGATRVLASSAVCIVDVNFRLILYQLGWKLCTFQRLSVCQPLELSVWT